MKKLIVIGGGGHCKSVLDCLDRELFEEIIIADRPERIGGSVMGIPIRICDAELSQMRQQGFDDAFIALGTVRADRERKALYEKLLQDGYQLFRVISPSAIVSRCAEIQDGVFVGKGAVINAGAAVGCCSIINTGAVVEHDCEIGAFTHIAPGCTLSGGVRIGKCTHIGAGAVLKQGIYIGEHVTIGAGSVVLRDVPDNAVAYGVPSKVVG